jgi:hypothetical protein
MRVAGRDGTDGGAAVDGLAPSDPRRAGPYTLVARLGSGGMGRVYLGFSPAAERVAVKVIKPEGCLTELSPRTWCDLNGPDRLSSTYLPAGR